MPDPTIGSEPFGSPHELKPGLVITSARYISAFVLGAVWPIATFLLPFLLDDPRPEANFVRLYIFAMYLGYPLLFFVSAAKYKVCLAQGKHQKALVLAVSPLVLLALWLVPFLGL